MKIDIDLKKKQAVMTRAAWDELLHTQNSNATSNAKALITSVLQDGSFVVDGGTAGVFLRFDRVSDFEKHWDQTQRG